MTSKKKKAMKTAFRRLGELARALSEPNRMTILENLCVGGEQSVTELRHGCEVDLSVVSRHLARLREAGLVKSDRRGRSAFYTANPKALAKTLRELADALDP